MANSTGTVEPASRSRAPILRFGIVIQELSGREAHWRTLASVIAQQHEDWYCVVVNDGDEDGTCEVIEALTDQRIRHVCETGGGEASYENSTAPFSRS